MKWLECDPLPAKSQSCPEVECYNCDIAGERWTLSQEDDLRTRRALKLRAIERLKREVAEIDAKLQALTK